MGFSLIGVVLVLRLSVARGNTSILKTDPSHHVTGDPRRAIIMATDGASTGWSVATLFMARGRRTGYLSSKLETGGQAAGHQGSGS
jgi:hypothetical protein